MNPMSTRPCWSRAMMLPVVVDQRAPAMLGGSLIVNGVSGAGLSRTMPFSRRQRAPGLVDHGRDFERGHENEIGVGEDLLPRPDLLRDDDDCPRGQRGLAADAAGPPEGGGGPGA